jgi:hypothetical protein
LPILLSAFASEDPKAIAEKFDKYLFFFYADFGFWVRAGPLDYYMIKILWCLYLFFGTCTYHMVIFRKNVFLYGRFQGGRFFVSFLFCLLFTEEPNRAKPRELGRIFPGAEPAQIKIAPHGQTLRARAAHHFPESGYFNSVPFSRSKEFFPFGNFWKSGRYKAKYRHFTLFC